ncbi:MAG: AAA family ATPase [Thermodesulfobacteriota bacterium]|nr:AAA family ATPase [Thermodesulfobacteriota bacterium]
MKKLPIGIQTFNKLIQDDYLYVDKTFFVEKLVQSGEYYFLSRPRRFGKSLFLSTLKSAFKGERELFNGLYLHDHWDWSTTYPVIHISFGSGVMRSVEELQTSISYILDVNGSEYAIKYRYSGAKERFAELIRFLHDKYQQQVVVLVDEYDKPILDNIHHPELAADIREELKSFYSVIKDSDEFLKFVFLTGVSKFSKVSLFSGLNNLEDITLTGEYSSICGYTQQELENTFSTDLKGHDLKEIRQWYNGYNWLGDSVYNPFDILLFLKNGIFRNYWFETGTPSFLIKLLQQRHYLMPDLERLVVGEEIIGSFDVDDIRLETLLFQAGYLTIESCHQVAAFREFTLVYPNLEVRSSLTSAMLSKLVNSVVEKGRNQSALVKALQANDLEKLRDVFHTFFAKIPHDWYRKNQLSRYEGYYASIVYCYFAALGVDVTTEESTNHGQIDMVVRFEDRVYVIEFKVIELTGTGNALQQIKDKGYAERFATEETWLIGVEFNSTERNIVNFEWERA